MIFVWTARNFFTADTKTKANISLSLICSQEPTEFKEVERILKLGKENPWEIIEKEFKKGDVIKGKVTKFSAFGAFVEIAPKIRGLCHISEFSSKDEMEKLLEIDKTYDFQVLLIEPKEHRMSLKLIK